MPETQKPPEKPEWTADDYSTFSSAVHPIVREVLDTATTIEKDYFADKRNERDTRIRRISTASSHNRRLAFGMMTFLVGVIALVATLTYFGKVSGDALLFLVGTVTGYALLMVQGLIHPLNEEEELESAE